MWFLFYYSISIVSFCFFFFFFFNDTATTEIYTLSLHDALPISCCHVALLSASRFGSLRVEPRISGQEECRHTSRDRKSTRLNSSHSQISYAVFCLKKKKKKDIRPLYAAQRRYHTSDCLNRISHS